MRRFGTESLKELVRAFCRATGSAGEEPELVARHLVEANLTGHDSHGIGLLPDYVRCVRGGMLVPNRHAEVARDAGAVLVIDGGRGYGQVIGHEGMQLGMARAAEEGVALLALRNSFHLGRIGHWGEQCARGGFASLHFVNGVDHTPLQAPFGGADARFGTNPLCAALPGPDGPAVLLDMATAKLAMGKVRVAMNQGVPVPEGSVLDVTGRPTRDPSVMYQEPRGALIAMGEHKGSGLAVVCELLAGALTGGVTIQPEHRRTGGIINNMLSIIIDPDALSDRSALDREVTALLAWMKASRVREGFEEVLAPGEPERRRRAERLESGIEIDERSWREIAQAARVAGVPDHEFDSLIS
jgi:hydroxycarboxylate dehydrogenase B